MRIPSSLLATAILPILAIVSAEASRPRWGGWIRRAFFARGGSGSATIIENSHQDVDNKQSHDGSGNNVTNQEESSQSSELVGNSTNSSAPMPLWKQALPPVLQRKGPKTLQKINLGASEIYLLGTAHVSNDSSADVKLLLEAVEPDCIFVELCESRIALLEGEEAGDSSDDLSPQQANDNTTATNSTNQTAASPEKQNFWDRLDNIRQSQGGSRLQALSTLLLTSVQEDYAETLGVELGGEFRAAHRYWKACYNNFTAASKGGKGNRKATATPAATPPSLVLGDRPLSLTLVRAWESLWWWPKTKVVAGLLWSSMHKPNPDEIRAWLESVLREETDVLTESLNELRKVFPSLHTTIIAERDAWLAAKLVQTSRILSEQAQLQQQQQQQQAAASAASRSPLFAAGRQQQQPPPKPAKKRVVAIVGAGHVPGIVRWLTGNITAATTTTPATPEAILRNLTFTKRWNKDETVQKEYIPMWTNEVTQVHHYNDEWAWAEPSSTNGVPS